MTNKELILKDLDAFLEHLDNKVKFLHFYYSGHDDLFNTIFIQDYFYNLTSFIKILNKIKNDIKNIREQITPSTDLILNTKIIQLYINSSKTLIEDYSLNFYQIDKRLKNIKIKNFNYFIKQYLILKVIKKLNTKLLKNASILGTNIRQLYFLTKTKNVTTIR